jgi:hypothetical protein
MRPLSLSREQSTKIIEMAKELFPEYINIRFGKNSEYNFIWMDSMPSTNPDPVDFHWFELCTTKIAIRLEQLIKENPEHREIMDFIPFIVVDEMMMKGNHPVDILYEQYKKLKNE